MADGIVYFLYILDEKFEFIILLGPFLFYMCKSWWSYGANTVSEFINDRFVKFGALGMLILHVSILYVYGIEWFCTTNRSRDPGPTITQFIPGLGYAFLCFSYAVSNRVFDSDKEASAETKVKLLGAFFIIVGYFYVIIYKISGSA